MSEYVERLAKKQFPHPFDEYNTYDDTCYKRIWEAAFVQHFAVACKQVDDNARASGLVPSDEEYDSVHAAEYISDHAASIAVKYANAVVEGLREHVRIMEK
jgi:hypothetical protein